MALFPSKFRPLVWLCLFFVQIHKSTTLPYSDGTTTSTTRASTTTPTTRTSFSTSTQADSKVGVISFESSPYRVYEGHDSSLRLTCQVTNIWSDERSLWSITLYRKETGGYGYIRLATVNTNSQPQLFDSANIAVVTGQIDDRSTSGRLTLEWAYPTKVEAGQYRCDVTAINSQKDFITEDHMLDVQVLTDGLSPSQSLLNNYRFLVNKLRLCAKSEDGEWERMFAAAIGNQVFHAGPTLTVPQVQPVQGSPAKTVRYFLSNFTTTNLDFAESTCRHIFSGGRFTGRLARLTEPDKERVIDDVISRLSLDGVPVIIMNSRGSTCLASEKTKYGVETKYFQMCSQGLKHSQYPFQFVCEKVGFS